MGLFDRAEIEQSFSYCCSLSRSLDVANKLVCCDADWEAVNERGCSFLVFSRGRAIAFGATDKTFHELVHFDDLEDCKTFAVAEELVNCCLNFAGRGGFLDVFVTGQEALGGYDVNQINLFSEDGIWSFFESADSAVYVFEQFSCFEE